MIPKPIGEICLSDLEGLVGVGRESKTLEFKAEMPGRAESDMVPFLSGISSFANTAGGDFVIGVAASDGVAAAVPGIAILSLDAENFASSNPWQTDWSPVYRELTFIPSNAVLAATCLFSAYHAAG